MTYLLLLAALQAAPTQSSTTAPPPRDGAELIRQMHDRYAGRWYRSLTFVQETTLPDGRVETWYEALSVPGLLRIDIAPLDSMHTLLFRHDSLYEFRGGRQVRAMVQVHPLLVLGFDVYAQPVEETTAKLTKLGFDLTKLHQTTWQGRPTYVVGAVAGDSTSPQFWIDRERLYFVRSLQPKQDDPKVRTEVRFDRYRPIGGGWVEMEVQFLVDGKQRMGEVYSNPRADVALDPKLFQPDRWVPPAWIEQ